MRSGIAILILLFFAFTLYAETAASLDNTLSRSERYDIYQKALQIAAENGNAFEVSMEAIPKYRNTPGLIPFNSEKVKMLSKKMSRFNAKANLAKWDWRDHDGVTPAKNQGACGSCWDFAATANLEHSIKCFDSLEVDLSEQDLLNCNKQGYDCTGGQLDCSEYFLNGAALEADCKYKATTEACSTGLTRAYNIKDWAFFTEDVEMMKSCIYYYGSIVTVVDADDPGFKAYSKGIYNVKGGTPNHAILAVGWDDSDEVFIIKNSQMGEAWGDKGYGKVKYGCACIGQENVVIDYKGQLAH
ncbi:MAG: C1 family peptidase [Candidatus Wallbacteria bacterium]|nr:C1 family peptidase [Candidatus Wallbacteria bacterium]